MAKTPEWQYGIVSQKTRLHCSGLSVKMWTVVTRGLAPVVHVTCFSTYCENLQNVHSHSKLIVLCLLGLKKKGTLCLSFVIFSMVVSASMGDLKTNLFTLNHGSKCTLV